MIKKKIEKALAIQQRQASEVQLSHAASLLSQGSLGWRIELGWGGGRRRNTSEGVGFKVREKREAKSA